MTWYIRTTTYGSHPALQLGDDELGSHALITPEHGATIVQIALRDKDGRVVPLLVPDSPEDFAANPLFRGRLLFPFNDRIPHATYRFDGATYHLPVTADDGSALHGFAWNAPFAVVDRHTDAHGAAITATYRTDPAAVPGYPFRVALRVTIRLGASAFDLACTVRNEGDRRAPVALGWHPYFRIGPTSRVTARFPTYVEVDDALVPTGKTPPTANTPWDFACGRPACAGPLDLGFAAPADGRIDLDPEAVRIEQRGAFTYTQLYLPDDKRSLAIEPITAATNSFNMPHLGLRVLEPQAAFSAQVTIRLA